MIKDIPPRLQRRIDQALAEEARRMLAESAPVVTGPGGDFLTPHYLGGPEVDLRGEQRTCPPKPRRRRIKKARAAGSTESVVQALQEGRS